MSETISFRVPAGTKEKLVAKAHRSNHTDLTSYLRGIVLHAADAGDEEVSVACALSTHELNLKDDQGCPLIRFVATARCNECPYREQPVVDREKSYPSVTRFQGASEVIDDLFKEDDKTTS